MSPESLSNIYHSLRNCVLVKTKGDKMNEDTLNRFTDLLNRAVPRPDDDGHLPFEYTFFRTYIYNEKKLNKAYRPISQENWKFILWMNTRDILNHFRLNRIVYLRWNKESRTYSAEKYEPAT